MPQPWDEPAEPVEQAADSLPLAGLLAELLARAEAEGCPEAAPPALSGPNAEPAQEGSWFPEPGSVQLEVADLMRALGEAEQERQEAAAADFQAELLARLAAEPAPEASGAPAVPSEETAPAAPSSGGALELELELRGAAGEERPELALEPEAPGIAGTEQQSGAAARVHAGASASPPDSGLAAAEGSSALLDGDGQAAPVELLFATSPGWDPASTAAPATTEPLPAGPAGEAAPPETAGAAPRTSSPGAGVEAGAASAAEPGRDLAPLPVPRSPVTSASAGPHRGLPAAVLPPEEDEFELVDAETAGRMLDQLIDAARSAIQSSLTGSQAQAAAKEAGESGYGREDEQQEPASGASGPPAGLEEAIPAPRPVPGRPSFSAEELGQEPPPLPPAAALMGMGLPERLRARLEQIGDLDRVLAAQSGAAAGKTVDRRSRLLVFRVGEEYYGLPIENVREVERVTRVTPVPGAPRLVRGLVNLRGEILPLVDMRLLLGAGAEGMPASPRLIVAQADRKEPPLALMVEELNGLAPLDEDEDGRAAPVPAEGRTGVRGAVEHRGRRVWRLDPAAVLGLAALEERADLR